MIAYTSIPVKFTRSCPILSSYLSRGVLRCNCDAAAPLISLFLGMYYRLVREETRIHLKTLTIPVMENQLT
jgi:hypothetical protein